MKYAAVFFKKHPFIFLHIIILATAFVSFRYYIERLFSPSLGMGWAYVVDQITPLVVTLAVVFFFVVRGINLKVRLVKFRTHRRFIVFVFVIAFVTHLGILSYYFWSDDASFILKPIVQNWRLYFHSVSSAMRGYFIASYALLYLVFGTNAWVYSFFNITYFAISVLFVYWFLYILTNRRFVAGLASLFFATTPAFLDMFTWYSTAHAPILIFGLASFILLLYYKKNNRFVYYVLSLMFFFCTIKMGFIRSAGLVPIPLLLLFLPLYKNAKRKPLDLMLCALPYIMIAIYFVVFDFLHQELATFAKTVVQTQDFKGAFSNLLQYRDVSDNSFLFFPKFLFFSAYLFFSSGLVSEILPFFRPLFPKISIALTLGTLTLLVLFISLLVGIKHRQLKYGWLAIFAVMFVFLNTLHSIIGYQAGTDFDSNSPRFVDNLDIRFAYENLGYGPGSRYLFIPSVGVSLLFALFVSWLSERKKIFSALAVIFLSIIIGSNTYFTIRSQVTNFKGTKQYRSLAENVFKTVPRDGKPKLLFSANPRKNGLDSKFTGWTWLYGFYKIDELTYVKDDLTFTSDHADIKELLKTGRFIRENLYAFYNNPDTQAFTDISEEAREYYFPKTKPYPIPIAFKFNSPKAITKITQESDLVNIAQRAVIDSGEISKQIIGPESFRFKLKIKKLGIPRFPFFDILALPKDKQYTFGFPLGLWDVVALPPWIVSTYEVIETARTEKSPEKELTAVNILQERERLMGGTILEVSSIDTGKNISKGALIDGTYTTYPRPRPEERYFRAKENIVTLTFSFPYTTGIKRILLNTPLNFSSSFPKKISIFTSGDNQRFQQVNAERLTQDQWSPNRGVLQIIEFATTINSRYLKLMIEGDSKPVVLDEIVIDAEQAASLLPQDIEETARRVYHYVDSEKLFAQLAQLQRYDRLTLLWACAEDSDWQRQLKNKLEIVPGIWNSEKVTIPHGSEEFQDLVVINCYGSKLRRIFFISPPYPVEIEIVEAVIEPPQR